MSHAFSWTVLIGYLQAGEKLNVEIDTVRTSVGMKDLKAGTFLRLIRLWFPKEIMDSLPGGRLPTAVVEAVKAALVSHGVFTVEGAEDERSTTSKTYQNVLLLNFGVRVKMIGSKLIHVKSCKTET